MIGDCRCAVIFAAEMTDMPHLQGEVRWTAVTCALAAFIQSRRAWAMPLVQCGSLPCSPASLAPDFHCKPLHPIRGWHSYAALWTQKVGYAAHDLLGSPFWLAHLVTPRKCLDPIALPKSSFGFSVISYRKIQMNFLANAIIYTKLGYEPPLLMLLTSLKEKLFVLRTFFHYNLISLISHLSRISYTFGSIESSACWSKHRLWILKRKYTIVSRDFVQNGKATSFI